MAKLDVNHLTIQYVMKRDKRALTAMQNVSFSAALGEFVAVIGPSGCGKSSLLNAIAGLIPYQQGEILLNDQVVRGPGRDRAMVFQSPALLPWRSILSNVGYGLELRGVDRATIQATAREFVALVGLEAFANSYPAELSGGMQQRANLARALAVKPQVLLCDEPLTALDGQTREYMQAELQRIWLERPTTTIYVTHQIAEAIFLADRVLVLSASPGTIKADIRVPLPRPRALSVQRTAEFVQIEEHIWSLLEHPAQLLAAQLPPHP